MSQSSWVVQCKRGLCFISRRNLRLKSEFTVQSDTTVHSHKTPAKPINSESDSFGSTRNYRFCSVVQFLPEYTMTLYFRSVFEADVVQLWDALFERHFLVPFMGQYGCSRAAIKGNLTTLLFSNAKSGMNIMMKKKNTVLLASIQIIAVIHQHNYSQ